MCFEFQKDDDSVWNQEPLSLRLKQATSDASIDVNQPLKLLTAQAARALDTSLLVSFSI